MDIGDKEQIQIYTWEALGNQAEWLAAAAARAH